MILSDHDIVEELENGELDISPIDLEEQLQPSSLDIRLGKQVAKYEIPDDEIIDIKDSSKTEEYIFEEEIGSEGIVIEPDSFYLMNTKESIKIPDYLEAELMGRSSLARLGIEIHRTAGLFDPGFEADDGVLEVSSCLDSPVRIYPGMRIAQLVFKELKTEAQEPYNSNGNKYQGQQGPQGSKISEDFK